MSFGAGARNDNSFGPPRDGGFGGNRNNYNNGAGAPQNNGGGTLETPAPVGADGEFNPNMTQVTIPKDVRQLSFHIVHITD